MPITYAPTVIADRLQALSRALDQHPSNPGQLRIYSGTVPSPGQSPSGTLLATLFFSKPSMASAANGANNTPSLSLSLSIPTPGMIVNTGIATWARLVDGAGVWVADVDVGPSTGSATLQIGGNNAQLYEGGALNAGVVTLTEA